MGTRQAVILKEIPGILKRLGGMQASYRVQIHSADWLYRIQDACGRCSSWCGKPDHGSEEESGSELSAR
jgi:hypothetical protein